MSNTKFQKNGEKFYVTVELNKELYLDLCAVYGIDADKEYARLIAQDIYDTAITELKN